MAKGRNNRLNFKKGNDYRCSFSCLECRRDQNQREKEIYQIPCLPINRFVDNSTMRGNRCIGLLIGYPLKVWPMIIIGIAIPLKLYVSLMSNNGLYFILHYDCAKNTIARAPPSRLYRGYGSRWLRRCAGTVLSRSLRGRRWCGRL